jgi:hypothetical protein
MNVDWVTGEFISNQDFVFIARKVRHLPACERDPTRDPSLRLKSAYAQDDAITLMIEDN